MSVSDTDKDLITKLIKMLERIQQDKNPIRKYSIIEEEKETNENSNNKAV